MNTFTLGVRNAFRNATRSLSIVIILGLSIGLSLVMLIAHQAVGQKINDVKSSVGNTISISPAGFVPGSEANNALTTSDLDKVKSLAHVSALTETLNDRLTTIGSATFGRFGNSSPTNNQTSLKSPINLSDVNKQGGGLHVMIDGSSQLPSNFSLPIQILGTNDPSHLDNGTDITIKSGKAIDGNNDSNNALISTDMANKNNLKVGSTFTAYGKTLTVAGTFDSGTKGGNNTVIVSLPAEQRLSGNSGDVSSATATVDSIDNLESATAAVKNTLGSNADVESSQDQVNNTIKPLENIQSVSLYSLVGAAIVGAIVILLVMIMIVRERRREIGILKAIGGSNSRIIFQFMSEALTFTILGAVIGLIIGIAGGGPVTNTLVTNSANSAANSQQAGPGSMVTRMGGPGMGFRRPTGGALSRNVGGIRNTLTDIHANVGWDILAWGLGAALFIAAIGSAFAGWLIARVRPSEVMRAE